MRVSAYVRACLHLMAKALSSTQLPLALKSRLGERTSVPSAKAKSHIIQHARAQTHTHTHRGAAEVTTSKGVWYVCE